LATTLTGSPNRLTAPLVRKNGELVESNWAEALKLVAEKFAAIKEAAGANALGGIAGARLSNEDLYVFQKFFREVIGTHNIDHRVGLSAALQDGTAHTVGVGRGTDLGRVGKGTTILVMGADLDQEAPILYLRVAGASVKRGACVINAGGRRTKLDAQAQTSLRYRYGTAAHLALALGASVIEQGLAAQEFVDNRTAGFAELKQAVQKFNPADVEKISGVSAGEINGAAKAFAAAGNGIILFGLEAGNDPALQAALEALVLVTGHAGKADNGLIAVLPHANSRGAADMGVLPDQLPGYVPVEGDPGLSAQQMLTGGNGLKAMLIAGADPAAESEACKSALEQLDFLVVQELFLTDTAQLADVVLPVRGTAERDGTFTNLERRVQAFDPGVSAPGHAWADWLVLCAISGQMGADIGYASADGVMAEIARQVPLYADMDFANLTAPISLARKTSHYIYEGMSYTAGVREGVQWPTLAEDSDTRLPLRFFEPVPAPVGEPGDSLTVVAPRFLYDGGRLLAEAGVVQAHLQKALLLLSRPDAQKLDAASGDSVTVSQNGTSVTLPAHINRSLTEGVALVPRNVAGRPAEKLLGPGGLFATVKVEKN